MSRGPGDSIEEPLEASPHKVEVDRPIEAKPEPVATASQHSNSSNSDSDSRPSDDDRRRRRGDPDRRGHDRHRGDQRRGDYRRRDDELDRYSIEREENDRRRSRRTRDLVTEDELNGGSDSDSANPSVRHREFRDRSDSDLKHKRSDVRSDDRSRNFSHSSNNNDRHHDNGRSRRNMGLASSRLFSSDDRYRPSRGEDHGRSRRDKDNRSRSPAPADRRSKDRSRSPAPAGRSKDRSRSPNGADRAEGSRGRRSRPGSPREEQTLDVDKHTIFVLQLAMRCREKDLERFFAQCGTVVKATLVTDRSGRSKGVGYVEFKDSASIDKALDLTGQKVIGQPIIVQRSEAQKNLQARTTSSNNANMPFHRLHVGNIHFSVSEAELRVFFEVFGEIEVMELAKGEDGRSKGHGYIQYKDPADAKIALETANNYDFGGRVLRLGLGHDSRSNESTESLVAKFNTQAAAAERMASAQSSDRDGYGLGDRGGYGGDRARNDKAGGASALDDNEVAGVAMTNHHRNSLMRKLAREPSPKENETRSAQGAPAISTATRHTRCVLLKNMYDPHGEDIQDVAEQTALRGDIKEECDREYGKVVHIALGLDLPNGAVYVKFADLEGSKKAVQALNGRWFDQRRMTAEYVADHIYHARYSEAARM